MHKAVDIAKYIIEYATRIGSPVSNLKLQKLLYYVQAAFLTEFNRQCFNEQILAWAYGPVIREVYDEFKIYGREDIPIQDKTQNLNFDYSKIQIVYQSDEAKLNKQEKNLIDKIVSSYAQVFNPFVLVEKTHSEDPWKNTEIGNEIKPEIIKEYYSTHREKLYNN